MSRYVVVRPVWRSFQERFLARAAAHVKKGGHAAIVRKDDEGVDMLLGVDKATGKITELGYWSVLSIEQQRWRRVKEGPAKGLAIVRVREDFEGAVLDWCERDSIHEGPTREVTLDCLECGACCHEANVVLDDADFDRWKQAGRKDLMDKAYLKRKNGRVTLRFLDNGRCRNLGRHDGEGSHARRGRRIGRAEACLSRGRGPC